MYLVLITALVTCRNVNGNESGNINGNINIFNDSNNNIDASNTPLITEYEQHWNKHMQKEFIHLKATSFHMLI